MKRGSLLLGGFGLLAMLAPITRGDVTVVKKPVAVDRRTFDPAHPPKNMPPLKGNEAAVTESKFDCQIGMNYRLVSHRRAAGGGCEATLQVQGMRVILQLQVIIWLPKGASAKLTAHEEGHRRIAERIFANAEPIARQIAGPIDGSNVVGDGEDCSAADKAAGNAAATAFCQAYLKQTVTVTGQVGDVYDDLTAHGTRAEPTEDEAIREAFAKVQPDDKRNAHPPAK